jgi:tellurite methyltransferase
MAMDEKTLWNKKYSEGSHSSLDPDPRLVSAYDEFLSGNPPGNALDVAGGVGRHAIWLAQRGWRVKLADISEVGIQQAQENAKHTGTEVLVSTEIRDLNTMQDLGREQYDLVIVFFFLQRELFPALSAALKPGGVLIYKTYTMEQKHFKSGRFISGPSHPMFLLEPNELLRAFSSLRVLHYYETVQEKGVAELVARK